MATRLLDHIIKTQQTTNGTGIIVTLMTVPANSILAVTAHVLARTSAGVRAAWVIYGAVGRDAGTASLVSAALDIVTKRGDGGASGWDTDVMANSNDAAVGVTGAIGATIDWLIWARVSLWTP